MTNAHFFQFFLSQKSYKWIIAKNENQFGFILRFGPPINFTIKTNSRNRYKLKYPKYRGWFDVFDFFSPNLSIVRICRCHKIFMKKSKHRNMTKTNYDHFYLTHINDSYSLIQPDSRPSKMHQKRGFLDWCCGCLSRGWPKIGFL